MQILSHQPVNRKINHISGKVSHRKGGKDVYTELILLCYLQFDDKLILFQQTLSKYKYMRKLSFHLKGNTDLTDSFLFFQSTFTETRNDLREG